MFEIKNIGLAFDLDGVITATAKLHFDAWRIKAKELNMVLSKEDNDKLRGLSRRKTAQAICDLNNQILNEKTFDRFCYEKNELYKYYLKTKLNDNYILGNMKRTLKSLKQKGYKIAITSSSRNALSIITKLSLKQYIDAIVDPNEIVHHKLAPDLYLKGASLIHTSPKYTIGIEDAPAGILGIINAGMVSVAVKWTNLQIQFKDADYIVETSNDLTIEFFEKVINEKIRI